MTGLPSRPPAPSERVYWIWYGYNPLYNWHPFWLKLSYFLFVLAPMSDAPHILWVKIVYPFGCGVGWVLITNHSLSLTSVRNPVEMWPPWCQLRGQGGVWTLLSQGCTWRQSCNRVAKYSRESSGITHHVITAQNQERHEAVHLTGWLSDYALLLIFYPNNCVLNELVAN